MLERAERALRRHRRAANGRTPVRAASGTGGAGTTTQPTPVETETMTQSQYETLEDLYWLCERMRDVTRVWYSSGPWTYDHGVPAPALRMEMRYRLPNELRRTNICWYPLGHINNPARLREMSERVGLNAAAFRTIIEYISQRNFGRAADRLQILLHNAKHGEAPPVAVSEQPRLKLRP